MATWKGTKYVGVRYREAANRRHRGRPEKYYAMRYKLAGKNVEEGVGWESAGITPQYCSNIRGEIVSNIKTGQGFFSLREKRDLESAKKLAKKSEAITLQQAFEDFLETRTLKDKTIREYKRSMEVAFGDWKNRRVIDISRDSVAQRHKKLRNDALKNFKNKCKKNKYAPTKEELNKSGSAQANLHLRFLRSLLNFCSGYYEDAKGQPLLKSNPVQRLSQTRAWYHVGRRQTIIKNHDLPAWYKTVTELENDVIRDYILFLLFTGSRKSEGLSLGIQQVDLKSRAVTVLDTKNRHPLTLPLPNYIFEILKKRILQLEGHRYVFPGADKLGALKNPKTHLIEPKRHVATVIERSKVQFMLHDLRRHFITVAEGLDLSAFSIKLLVNHSTGQDVTGGYVMPDIERLRRPMQKIEDKILQLAKANEPGKIVNIKEGR